jgi:hypothetical protein
MLRRTLQLLNEGPQGVEQGEPDAGEDVGGLGVHPQADVVRGHAEPREAEHERGHVQVSPLVGVGHLPDLEPQLLERSPCGGLQPPLDGDLLILLDPGLDELLQLGDRRAEESAVHRGLLLELAPARLGELYGEDPPLPP